MFIYGYFLPFIDTYCLFVDRYLYLIDTWLTCIGLLPYVCSVLLLERCETPQ